jgi:hypothetical protein
MPSRNFDLSQTPSDSILVFPDVPPTPPSGQFMGAVSAATKFAQLGFFNPSAVYLPVAGGTLTGPLILAADPTAALGAATKQYVDNRLPIAGGQMLGPLALAGDPTTPLQAATKQYVDVKLAITGGTMTGFLVLSADPQNALQAATKQYVDGHITTATSGFLPLAGGTLSGSLLLAADPVVPSEAATKRYADRMVPLAGGTLTGALTLAADPTTLLQPATKQYADTKLALAGGTLTGALTLAADPGSNLQAATKQYVDGRITTISNSYLPLVGGTLSGALNLSLLNIATVDLTKALTITPDDTLPADIRFVDEFGNAAVMINPDGTLQAASILATQANIGTLNVTTFTQPAVVMPNTTIYEIAGDPNDILIQDEFGFVAFAVDANGLVEAQNLSVNTFTVSAPGGGTPLSGSALLLTYFTITEVADGLNDVLFMDEFGFVAFGILGIGGGLAGGGGSGGSGGGTGGDDPNSYYPSLLTARDALATAQSMAVRDNINSKVAAPIWSYNHLISYGQSLSVGILGDPRISLAEGLDNLCFGDRPLGNQGTGGEIFSPIGGASFFPLDANKGSELPGIGAANQWRKLQLRWRTLSTDTTRRLVFNGCGQSGQAIEQLSKGASPNIYGQIPSLVTQAKAAATVAGGSYGVVAVYFLQGETNYQSNSFDNTQAGYLAKWEQLKSDISADIMAITGQELPPMFISSQPSSVWDLTGDICAIGNAQLQAALTAPTGDYLGMPNYQVPNDSGGGNHLCSDGYRWLGTATGYLLHRIIDRGEGWLPLYVTRASYRGQQILLECHTPEPPLQQQAFWGGADGATLQPIYGDLGFVAGDDLGLFVIGSVRLLNSTVLLTVNRPLSSANHPWVQYADKTRHQGNGNVCDSAAFLSLDPFSSGVPSMTGQLYPLWNWLVAFRMTVVSDV